MSRPDAVDRLVGMAAAFDHGPSADQAFLEAMQANFRRHVDHCAEFRRYCSMVGVMPEDIRTYEDVFRIPHVFVTNFKRRTFITGRREDVKLVLTSQRHRGREERDLPGPPEPLPHRGHRAPHLWRLRHGRPRHGHQLSLLHLRSAGGQGPGHRVQRQAADRAHPGGPRPLRHPLGCRPQRVPPGSREVLAGAGALCPRGPSHPPAGLPRHDHRRAGPVCPRDGKALPLRRAQLPHHRGRMEEPGRPGDPQGRVPPPRGRVARHPRGQHPRPLRHGGARGALLRVRALPHARAHLLARGGAEPRHPGAAALRRGGTAAHVHAVPELVSRALAPDLRRGAPARGVPLRAFRTVDRAPGARRGDPPSGLRHRGPSTC